MADDPDGAFAEEFAQLIARGFVGIEAGDDDQPRFRATTRHAGQMRPRYRRSSPRSRRPDVTVYPADLLHRLAGEVRTLDTQDAELHLVIDSATALHLVGLLQLATRHPAVSAKSRAVVDGFITGAAEYFKTSPAVLEAIRLGADPRYDASPVLTT
jgi:hypothetical protein